MDATSRERDGQADGAGHGIGSVVERALYEATLEFHAAAVAVIDHRGLERPRLRFDLRGLADVRAAMSRLARRVEHAHRTGWSTERIVRVTRLERDVVEAIVAGGPPPPGVGHGPDERDDRPASH